MKGEEGLVPKTYLQHVPIDVMEEEKKVTQMIDVKEIRQPFIVQRQDSPPLQEPAKPTVPSVTHVSVRYPGQIPKPKVKEEAKEAQVVPQDQTHDPQDVPHMKEVVMKATTPVPPRPAIASPSMTRSYSAGQIVDPNVPVDSSLPEPHMPISIQLPEKASTRPIRCLGDALRADPHLTYACHLTPRLSYSNLAFHDLYWNYQDDKLRKRHVRVSKLIRLFRLEGMPKTDVVCGLIRAALYDRSRKTGRQIVSNVHTIRATINNGTWSFVTRTDTTISGIDYGDFLLRSNYKMEDVLLLIEVSAIVRTETGGKQEQSLGIFKYPIVGANGECCLVNRTYAEFLSSENIFDKKLTPNHEQTQFKIVLKVLDVPKEIVPVVDAMPDILLFNPMYVRMAYYYRRRAGTILIRDRINPLSAEMVTDPLLACFPGVCDQPDLLDFLRDIWSARYKLVKNKSEHDQAASFFQTFLNTAYAIYRTAQMPQYDITDAKLLAERQQTISKCIEMLRQHRTAAKFLLTQPAKPLNIFDYSFDLMGPHALD
ncbi:hypothetical protein WR25_14702 [Diploscapter pachys]|uniref:Uncharacterized protein n=1 Tax=Diploscapter pachys TaxID=2018661 RepID=A0A2A2KNJ0_9BILA|nr:hypothetical protein WR25_14702 [Diploscapter pachys]